MTTKANGSVQGLLLGAGHAGVVSQGTLDMLGGDLGNVVIAGAAGMDTEDIVASDVTLITVLIDASSSIASSGLEDAVRDGQNALIDAFRDSKEKDSVLLALWTFGSDVNVVHSYVPIDDATRLDASNYAGAGATRLYDTWVDALAANVAYAEQLRASGTPCKSVAVVVTDGADCGSRRRATDCARISKDLLASERFQLAFVGVGADADFRPTARSMGVPEGSIAATGAASPSAVRRMFHMVSQSAVAASQRVVGGAVGGFFGP